MMQVITNSYANVVSSFFGAKFGRHIEELMVSPLPNSYIVLGYITGGVLRGLLVGGDGDGHRAVLHRPAYRGTYPLITISVVLFTAIVFSPGRPHQRGVREEVR